MKKLIVLAAVAVAASFANAASLNWKVITTGTDQSIYIVKSLTEFENLAAVQAAVYGTSDNSATSAKNGRGGSAWYGNAATIGGISDNDVGSQTVYAVVISGDGKGYWAVSGSGDVYTTATTPAKATIDMTTAMAGNYTAWKTDDPQGAPEPTSGLLLLLGMAGLALRRKQA